jgi:hypothetical protein
MIVCWETPLLPYADSWKPLHQQPVPVNLPFFQIYDINADGSIPFSL